MWVLSLHIHLYCSSTVQLWIKYFLNKLAERDLCLFWRKALNLADFASFARGFVRAVRAKGHHSFRTQTIIDDMYTNMKNVVVFIQHDFIRPNILYNHWFRSQSAKHAPVVTYRLKMSRPVNKPLFWCWLWGRRDIYADKFRAHWLINYYCSLEK